jgi:hypothetical protein
MVFHFIVLLKLICIFILFYGFETWSLIIREEHMLRVLGQGAAGNMREELTRLKKISYRRTASVNSNACV